MAKPDWITLSKSSGTGNATVTVTAAKNPNKAVRSGYISVKSGSITKTVQLTQDAHKDSLVWLTQPNFEGDLSSSMMTIESDAPEVQYLQNGASFDKSKVYGYLTHINGGDVRLGYKFDPTDSEQRGLALSMQIVSHDTKTNITVVSFTLKITSYEKLEAWFNDKYQGDGSTGRPHYGHMSFVIGGLVGEDGKEVRSDKITIAIYAPVAATSKGIVRLEYSGSDISSKVSIGQTIYESVDGWDVIGTTRAEFYQPIGTVKSVDGEQLTIDLSGLTSDDVDRIYNDLNTGDQSDSTPIYFGISSEDDPEASWTPLLKTEDVGGFSYASQNVADIIKGAYDYDNELIISCTSQETTVKNYIVSANAKLCTLTIAKSIFDSLGVSTLIFYAQAVTTNGRTYNSSQLSLRAPSSGSVSGNLMLNISNWNLGKADTITRIELLCTGNYPIMSATASPNTVTCYNNKPYSKSFTATFQSIGSQYLRFVFSSGIPIVAASDANTISIGSSYPTVIITELASKPSIVSELTIGPEDNSMDPDGGIATYTVNYENIVLRSIEFVPGDESEWSDGYVYLSNWPTLSGDSDESGAFDFEISCTSEVISGASCSFSVKGMNSNGEEYEFYAVVNIN